MYDPLYLSRIYVISEISFRYQLSVQFIHLLPRHLLLFAGFWVECSDLLLFVGMTAFWGQGCQSFEFYNFIILRFSKKR